MDNINNLQNPEKLAELKAFIAEKSSREYPESSLVAVLHKTQGLYGYLDRTIIDLISIEMKIPAAHIWGVATFYHYFNLKPRGQHVISVCLGTACYVKGAEKILDALKAELNITMGDTTPDGFFTLQETRCLGACGLAPVMMIDNKIHGELTVEKVKEIINGIRSHKKTAA